MLTRSALVETLRKLTADALYRAFSVNSTERMKHATVDPRGDRPSDAFVRGLMRDVPPVEAKGGCDKGMWTRRSRSLGAPLIGSSALTYNLR